MPKENERKNKIKDFPKIERPHERLIAKNKPPFSLKERKLI